MLQIHRSCFSVFCFSLFQNSDEAPFGKLLFHLAKNPLPSTKTYYIPPRKNLKLRGFPQNGTVQLSGRGDGKDTLAVGRLRTGTTLILHYLHSKCTSSTLGGFGWRWTFSRRSSLAYSPGFPSQRTPACSDGLSTGLASTIIERRILQSIFTNRESAKECPPAFEREKTESGKK